MGTTASGLASLQETQDNERQDEHEQGENVCLTPSKRVLYVDPRSPSTGISRTPIVVEKTPPTDLFVDPRSPTPGIVRTPITNAAKDQKVKSLKMQAENTIEGPCHFGPALADLTEDLHLESDERDLLGLQGLSLLELSGDEDSQLIPAGDCEESSKCHKVGKPVLPKQLFTRKEKKQGNRTNSSETRSPLRMRTNDTDSPRNIIQRKQMKSLDTKISYRCAHSSESTPPSQDKENVNM